jgi:hypothetical protein
MPMSQQDNTEICPECRKGRMVWTGFASVSNEPNNPAFDVMEDQRYRQCDVCGYRDRSVSEQERVGIKEEAQIVLTRQDNESPAATTTPAADQQPQRQQPEKEAKPQPDDQQGTQPPAPT